MVVRDNFLTNIFYKKVQKQIIKSKVKADVDYVNHYFLKKHLLWPKWPMC